MNLFKDRNPYGYLQEILEEDKSLNFYISHFLGQLLHGGITRILSEVKSKGYKSENILTLLMLLPLMDFTTINRFFDSKMSFLVQCKKDVLYRFKNNPKIPWRKVLFSISKRFLKYVEKIPQTSGNKGYNCLIFDDTTIDKTGKTIEFISKVFNHVTKRVNLGQKVLTMAYWNGASLIPIDFSLHRESGKNTRKPFGFTFKELANIFTKKRAVKDASTERVKEVDKKKTLVVLEMINRALENRIKVDYVLADSWFFNFELLNLIVKKGIDLVARAKMAPMKFSYKGKEYSGKSLVAIFGRKAKYSRKMKAHYIQLNVEYKGIKCRIYLIRFGNQKTWNLLVSSDTKMTFIKAMEIYQIRWGIEVFFKEAKQYLGLGKCQSKDFDAHIAHISVVFMAYTALALKKAADSQYTIGQLFEQAKIQFFELTLAEKLWDLFISLITSIFTELELDIFKSMKKMFHLRNNHQFLLLLETSIKY